MKKGFSLIELSIVLVILGLLVGGILAGQSLIRASELRAVTAEYNRWITVTQAFRDKYFALPGDLTNAASIWGRNETYCATDTGTNAGAAGTCNGNGNGSVNNGATASTSTEIAQYWKQLSLAGLIEGTYTGIAGPGGGGNHCVPLTNCPASKLSGAAWSPFYLVSNYAGSSNGYALGGLNVLVFGAKDISSLPNNPILKPEEAWNIDTKMDDGKPASGTVIIYNWPACTTSTSQTDFTGEYKLTSNTLGCAFYFRRAY